MSFDYLNRVICRSILAVSHTAETDPYEWRYEAETCGTVIAYTECEARAKIKRVLGFHKRLPQYVKIERLNHAKHK
jgi:hypothetical protein